MPIFLGFQTACSDCGHVYKTFGGHACPRPSKHGESAAAIEEEGARGYHKYCRRPRDPGKVIQQLDIRAGEGTCAAR